MDKVNQFLTQSGLQPISKKSVLYFYMPLKGSCAFVFLGAQMMAPEMFDNFTFLIVPRYISLTNACLAHSLIGSSLYIYSRKHLEGLPETSKVSYSLLGGCLLNLGGVLGMALCRSFVGEEGGSTGGLLVRAVAGGAAAFGLLKIAKGYLNDVDAKVK